MNKVSVLLLALAMTSTLASAKDYYSDSKKSESGYSNSQPSNNNSYTRPNNNSIRFKSYDSDKYKSDQINNSGLVINKERGQVNDNGLIINRE